MQTREDLVELARACLKQAGASKNPVVVAELTRLAKGYQMRAATMDNGQLPDIGEQAAGRDEGIGAGPEMVDRLNAAPAAARINEP